MLVVAQMGERIQRFKNSPEYKKWKIARFFTLYCDSPTEPEEITEETVLEFDKIFSDDSIENNEKEN
jgi:hypothetical protein